VLNVVLANLAACSDVVLWGVDLKGGMELRPWAPCLDRLATTPREAAALLRDAVAMLDQRTGDLGDDGARVWVPTPDRPALVVVIDEYAELAEHSPEAITAADSIARRGRAVAVTLLAATQRPTQDAMGKGAVRSQMDIRICLRVRERRDVDLILGQGMLNAGWHAHALDAPGKFLISAPGLDRPRRARAYLLTDAEITAAARRHTPGRPTLHPPADHPYPTDTENADVIDAELLHDDPDMILWSALRHAPPEGLTVPDLMHATGMRRTWVYDRLHEHSTAGNAVQVSRGRWRAAPDA
jgi:S-DNA-T family DNA segregation ATPase FtsK/SpoIIIE